ncbi:MAG: nucleotide sugar dehydrogenase [Bacteroidia bacterium]|nr:nucleotide sugar dehydrogenase [Bacteroidia bacterium]
MRLFNPSLLDNLGGNADVLAKKLENKTAVIGVAGLGYVGMPIALEFAKMGYKTIGVDPSRWKIESLQKGKNYIEDLSDAEVAEVIHSGMFISSAEYDVLADADVIYICVPTPFNANKDPDLAYVISAGEGVSSILKKGQLIILKSTTFPGTTEDYLIPVLNKSGLSAGTDYYIAFSPERVDPGNKQFNTANTPIVVGGIDSDSSILAALANSKVIEKVYMVDNPKVAELEKLLENIFRSVNIALVNELALLCERMGDINVWEVIEAASTKPFGYLKFQPGPGVGGHCIPIDPYYLSWLAREYDFETKFITLAANVNEGMPYHVANLVVREIANLPISISQAKVLIVGVSFKKNVKDLRHSPAESVIIRLIENGIRNIDITDPWVEGEGYEAAGTTYYTKDISPEMIASYDVVVLITDHDDFDIPAIVKHSRKVIDTRNMAKNITENRDNIILLGSTPKKEKIVMQH